MYLINQYGVWDEWRQDRRKALWLANDMSGLAGADLMRTEVRMARIGDAIGRHKGGELSWLEAAEGLIDGRRGKVSGRRAPVDTIEWVLEQYALFRLHHKAPPRSADGGAGGFQAKLHLDQ